MKRAAICLFFVFALTLTLGCGSSKESLSGKVTFEDGKPLEMGTVCFLRDDFLARGDIQSDGTYVVGSTESADGLPAGTYQVYIDGAVVEDLDAPAGVSSLIDEKMTSPETSELTCDVPVPGGEFDITVAYPE